MIEPVGLLFEELEPIFMQHITVTIYSTPSLVSPCTRLSDTSSPSLSSLPSSQPLFKCPDETSSRLHIHGYSRGRRTEPGGGQPFRSFNGLCWNLTPSTLPTLRAWRFLGGRGRAERSCSVSSPAVFGGKSTERAPQTRARSGRISFPGNSTRVFFVLSFNSCCV